jgi:hypothetical protein
MCRRTSAAIISNTNENQKSNSNESHEVSCIVPFSKGFLASCGNGKAFLFEKNDEKEFFRKIRELKIPADIYSNDPSKSEEQIIVSMCISPSEETILAVTSWQQIYQLVFSNIDVGKVIFM